MKSKSFTQRYQGVTNKIINKADIVINGKNYEVKALWDTGATCSVISMELAKKLKLPSIGTIDVLTPSGIGTYAKYIINIKLPNGLIVNDVIVCESEIGKQNIDLLVGMNLISLGNFAISNINGITTFSYQVPGVKEIDFNSI